MSKPSSSSDSTWQNSVPQQYRSDEISKIATELAKLDASSSMQSKLGLASKFENMIFTSATSIDDYHKKISKRLKKLIKNYDATSANKEGSGALGSGGGGVRGKGGAGGGALGGKGIEEEIVLKKRNLRMLYGDTMRLIAENGKTAADAYPRLVDHIDKANEYAAEIGAIPSNLAVKVGTGKPIVLQPKSPHETLEFLKLLEKTLESKISTLREWILKYSYEEK